MGTFDFSTTLLTNNSIQGVTTTATSTTAGIAYTLDKDDNHNTYFNFKRATSTLTTTTTTTAGLNSYSKTGLPDSYTAVANQMNWTIGDSRTVNDIRDIEEWFISLPEDQQEKLLLKIDEKLNNMEENQKDEILETKSYTKHM